MVVAALLLAITATSWTVSRSVLAAAGLRRPTIIAAVRVEGTNRIEVETVVSYMLIKPGDPYDIARDQLVRSRRCSPPDCSQM